MHMIQEQQRWERAEIDRSEYEALNTPTESLVVDERNVRRYLDPPSDTAYPLEYAFSLLGDLRSRVVVDFGCGTGDNSVVLARRGARVIGMDISRSLLRLARRRMTVNAVAGSTDFVVGSAHDLPVRDGSVDVVLGIAILHHLDLAATSRELHRVLKSDGIAVFQEPVRDSGLMRGMRRLIPYRAADVSPFERPLTTPELRAFCARFEVSAWRTFSLPFVNFARVVPPLRRHLGTAYAVDQMLLSRFPALKRFSGIHVLAVRKRR